MAGKHPIQSALDAVLARVNGVVNVILFCIMVAMALVLGANIALRYLFDSPITWSNVVSRYAYIYIVLLGTAISYAEGSHAQIDVIHQMVPARIQWLFDLSHFLVMVLFCGLLVYFGSVHALDMWAVHSTVVTWLPIGLVYLAVPLSAVVMLVFLVRSIVDLFFKHR